MSDQTATVQSRSSKQLSGPNADDGEAGEGGAGDQHRATIARTGQSFQMRGDAMRFSQASGSRPLEGYTIKRGIGTGGFGEVYFATSDAGKELALKLIRRNLDIELRGVSQCINLKHPNLLAIFDIKYDDMGDGWVVMEYVAGESLKEVIDAHPDGMPLDLVNHWFSSLAAGVGCLHENGIVHRDIKPGNIFDDSGVVKVGDYGLAKFISVSRRSGQTESVGTLHYMAPEIGKGIYGREIDVYALGVMLFEMLKGHVPFDGESTQEIIMRHLTDEPDLAGIAEPYRSVIKDALAKDPANRISTVDEMLSRLELGPANVVPDAVVRVNSPGTHKPRNEHQAGAKQKPRQAAVNATKGSKPDEPIAKAINEGWDELCTWWSNVDMPSGVKTCVLIAAIVMLVINFSWAVPLVMALSVFYCIYWCVRAIVLEATSPVVARTPSTTSPVAAILTPVRPVAPPPEKAKKPEPVKRVSHRRRERRRRPRWQDEARKTLAAKTGRQRMTEWLGSLLMAVLVSGLLCAVVIILPRESSSHGAEPLARLVWLGVSCVIASWTLLTLGKLWESRKGEHMPRRFVMLAAGLGIGAVVAAVASLLLVDFPYAGRSNDVLFDLYKARGIVPHAAFLVFFTGLLVPLRWWRQADPLRETRLSIWDTVVCVVWAAILNLAFPFPQPWGFVLAAMISITIQLSASWMSRSERQAIRDQIQLVQTQA